MPSLNPTCSDPRLPSNALRNTTSRLFPSSFTSASAQILLQSITTEARQQYTFRQFEGLFPMPEWFETGIPQTWAWTLLSPWIVSCPEENQPLAWEIYTALNWTNQPDAIAAGKAAGGPSISNNVTALT